MNRIKDTPAGRQRVLAVLTGGGTLEQAAAAAGASRWALRKWRNADPDFDAACKDAIEAGTDSAEDILSECAGKALQDPRYQTSLIFLLKNRRPKVWRDAHDLHHVGGDGEPIRVEIRRAGGQAPPVSDQHSVGEGDDAKPADSAEPASSS